MVKIKKDPFYFFVAGAGFISTGFLGTIFSLLTFSLIDKFIKKRIIGIPIWTGLGILSFWFIALPRFTNVQPSAEVSAMKNGLTNGIKQCVVNRWENQDTKFSEVPSYRMKTKNYSISPLSDLSCFGAYAYPRKHFNWFLLMPSDPPDYFTWFKIEYDPSTGIVTRSCGDTIKVACKEGNTW